MSQEPHYILYILHTPRGEGKPGRYQSPELFKSEVINFISKYRTFLRADSRFDIWVHSPNNDSTIVWDRHNLIHMYGMLDQYEGIFVKSGFLLGEPSIDFAHVHHYHSRLDDQAKGILTEFDWTYTPLKPADVQCADNIQ